MKIINIILPSDNEIPLGKETIFGEIIQNIAQSGLDLFLNMYLEFPRSSRGHKCDKRSSQKKKLLWEAEKMMKEKVENIHVVQDQMTGGLHDVGGLAWWRLETLKAVCTIEM